MNSPFDSLRMIAKATMDMPKMKPRPRCLLCEHVFTKRQPPPAAFVLLFASVDDPNYAMTSGLCIDCATQDHLSERVTQKYKESMITDLRVLPQPSAPGRA
jgi:hypothetical protein